MTEPDSASAAASPDRPGETITHQPTNTPVHINLSQPSTTSIHSTTDTTMPQSQVVQRFVLAEQPLKLSFFSGDGVKGDADYDLWKYEVDCLQVEKTHSEEAIKTAIRKSLRGTAGKAIINLGATASLSEILHKLELMFGLAARKHQVLREFYNTEQTATEDVTAWGCRIEELMRRAVHLGAVSKGEVDEMLRERFWHGLRQDLQQGTAHKYDAVKNFDELRSEIRTIEEDRRLKKVSLAQSNTAKMTVHSSAAESDTILDLKNMVKSLATTVESLKQEIRSNRRKPPGRSNAYDNRRCYNCNQPGHLKRDCPRSKRRPLN